MPGGTDVTLPITAVTALDDEVAVLIVPIEELVQSIEYFQSIIVAVRR